MAEVLDRTVTVRVALIIALCAAVLAGGLTTAAAMSMSGGQSPPSFHVVTSGLGGPCEGAYGRPTSCPIKATLRNDGGPAGGAMFVVTSSVYNLITDQTQPISCSSAVPRTAHGDTVDVSCTLVAGFDRYISATPTIAVR